MFRPYVSFAIIFPHGETGDEGEPFFAPTDLVNGRVKINRRR